MFTISPTTLDALIPMTRFNRGEADKIFEEVEQNGIEIVLKNNTPVSVILPVQEYKKLMNELEDMMLCDETRRRLEEGLHATIPAEELYAEAGITQKEIDEAEEVEIE